MAGEREEDVVERRAAHRDVVDAQLRLVEPAHRLHQRAAAVLDRQAHRAPVDLGLHVDHAAEHPGRLERHVLVREVDLEPLAADAVLELVGGAVGDHAAVVDDRDAVGQPVGLVEVLGGEEDGRAVGDERLDRLPQVEPAARVEPGRRLVEEEHRRARDERGGEVEPAPHAARVRLRHAGAGVAQAEALEQLRGARLGGAAAVAVEAADHGQVLEPGEVLVDRRVLAREADAGAELRGLADHVEAGHAGRAGVGGEERGEDADRRRLARAVRPEHAEHGAGGGLELDAVERAHVAERLDEAADLDRWGERMHQGTLSTV